MFRFRAHVELLDDVEYAGITQDQVLQLIPGNYNHSSIAIVDQIAIAHPEHPLLIVDLFEGSGHALRAVPSAVQSIEKNLSIANMGFVEFAEAVDGEGVFRGFSREM